MGKAGMMAGALVLVGCTFGGIHGQSPRPRQSEEVPTATAAAAPLAFEVVSVKPAPPGAFPIVPAFMRDKGAPVLGQQTMAAPVAMTIAYAYHLQMSEAAAAFRKQPEWVRSRIYTETFRAAGDPTRDQLREMMRTMLADRFGLQVHEFTREGGAVNRLVMGKPGVPGPNLKPHPEGAKCSTQEGASVGKAPDASTPPIANCGVTWYYLPGMVLHVGFTDTTIADACRALAGFGGEELKTLPLVDATGLTGKYDLTLEYNPLSPVVDSGEDGGGAPTLIQALKEQLGIRVESGTGPVRMVVIDHISEPTPD